MRLLNDEQMDALIPTPEERDAYLAEPTPLDEVNQYFDRTLTPEQKRKLAFTAVFNRNVAKAQRVETLKEVGDEMMKMSTLQEFHALRVRLIQGKLDV